MMGGPWCVMCCRCQRLMDKDGKASVPFALQGNVDLRTVSRLTISDRTFAAQSEEVPSFPSREAADEWAKEHGWKIVQGDHCCRECYVKLRPEPVRPGAYVEIVREEQETDGHLKAP